MKKLFLVIVMALWGNLAFAEHLALDKLLSEIKQTQAAEGKIDAAKEAAFVSDPGKQKQILESAQAELAKLDAVNKQLKTELTGARDLAA